MRIMNNKSKILNCKLATEKKGQFFTGFSEFLKLWNILPSPSTYRKVFPVEVLVGY